MKKKKNPILQLIVLGLLIISFTKAGAQHTAFNFHKLSLDNGLHDGTIRCIGQDKYGYIWIGSAGALNRFDGRSVKQFTNIPGDTTSAYSSQPRSIFSDSKGHLWIGTETGLMEYDFKNAAFKRMEGLKGIYISKIAALSDSILLLATRRGLARYNHKTGTVFFYGTSQRPEHAALQNNTVHDFSVRKNIMYLATNEGLIMFDLNSDKAVTIHIPELKNTAIISAEADATGNIWIGTNSKIKLVRLQPDLKKVHIYDNYLSSALNTQPLNVMDILVDSKNRVWVVTAIDGLLEYVESSNSFIKHLHNSSIQYSPLGNNYRSIFQDKDGTIWLGCDYLGVNFFNPDNIFFKTIFPFPDRLDERARNVARAITEDKKGNLWMGTHDGVSKLDQATNKYTVWRNEENQKPVIYNNVVRSIYCDEVDHVWIGTASGVNRINSNGGKMEFISDKDLPLNFYNSINADRSGNIWFCTNDSASLYWYSTVEKKFNNISHHPQLKKYKGFAPVSYVMEDSKSRLWISFSRKGVVMLDKKTLLTKHYLASDTAKLGIIGNQVVDIKEDKNGAIWISSLNGITGIDVEKNSFLSFNNKNGLAGNWTSPLVADKENRLWVGVNGGLMMLHDDRKHFTTFSLSDGLPSVGFPEHAGIQTANGDIIMPSYNGFIRFHPSDFMEEATNLSFYISGISVFDKEYNSIREDDANPVLHLGSKENSFTFNLVALNFTNPSQTWFAYKLEGFENDWHFTKDAKAVYTNIPGDNYTFLYKASSHNNSWNEITGKKLVVKLNKVYYKTVWFRLVILLLIVFILTWVYRYRSRQQNQVFQLKNMAQLLEKEKVQVMYENLKQHLNPHFLFNSLTSLSSLIRVDQQMAGNFLDNMSKVYRYILKNKDNETVPLSEELKFVDMYIQLQKTRLEESLVVHIDIDKDYYHRKIAPVTLQNLVENAIKHNVADAELPLVIKLFIDREDNLVVQNNLQKKNFVETSNKHGLANMESLYRYLSDRPMQIQEDEKYFTVKIPLL